MGGIIGRLFREFAITISVGDPRLRLGLADADADAVQPVAQAAHARASSTAPLQLDGEPIRRVAARLRAQPDWVMRHRQVTLAFSLVDPRRRRRCFRRHPEGASSRPRTRADHRDRRGRAGHVVRGDGAAPEARSADRREGPERRVVHRRTSAASAGRRTRRSSHHAQAARAAPVGGEMVARAARQAGAGPGHRSFLQNPPAIRIGGARHEVSYQYTLQGPDIEELYDGRTS